MERQAATYGSAVKVVGGEEKTRSEVEVAGELPGFVLRACSMWGWSRELRDNSREAPSSSHGEGLGSSSVVLKLKVSERRITLAKRRVSRYSRVFWGAFWFPKPKKHCCL